MNRSSKYGFALAAALTVAGSAAAQPIQSGLIVYLPFNGNVSDAAPGDGAQNGTIVRPFGGSATDPGNYGAGVNAGFGQGFRSRGTVPTVANVSDNNYVTLGTQLDTLLANPTGSFSMSFWANFAATGKNASDPAFISNKNWLSGGNTGFVVSANGNSAKENYRAEGQTRNDLNGTAVVNNGLWHHYAVTYDRGAANVAAMYIDNVPVTGTASLNGSGSLVAAGLALNIMQDGTGNYTDGTNFVAWLDATIDDLGLWNRVITPAEVGVIYNGGLAGLPLSAVPEPTSLALAGMAVVAGGVRLLRRRRTA